MIDLMPIVAVPFAVLLYCLFVLALADSHDIEAAQRLVCVFDDSRPYCEMFGNAGSQD